MLSSLLSVAREIQGMLDEPITPETDCSHRRAICHKLLRRARNGNVEATRLVFTLAGLADLVDEKDTLDRLGAQFDEAVETLKPEVREALDMGLDLDTIRQAFRQIHEHTVAGEADPEFQLNVMDAAVVQAGRQLADA